MKCCDWTGTQRSFVMLHRLSTKSVYRREKPRFPSPTPASGHALSTARCHHKVPRCILGSFETKPKRKAVPIPPPHPPLCIRFSHSASSSSHPSYKRPSSPSSSTSPTHPLPPDLSFTSQNARFHQLCSSPYGPPVHRCQYFPSENPRLSFFCHNGGTDVQVCSFPSQARKA